MKKLFMLLALSALMSLTVAAQPLWLRYPKISPDGTEIVFTYKGDIYKVAATGGDARQLTTHSDYESHPIWSPDGKSIAFTSDRFGNFDIFIMPATGGPAQRVTTYSGGEIPYAFTPDGKEIVYSAGIQDPASSALFPTGSMTELYAVPVTGGRPRQLLGTPAESISFSRDGKCFLFMDKKGGENIWRKHHTSSITRDIWMYDLKNEKFTALIERAGEDRDPVFAPDQQHFYFLSERDGSFNVYRAALDNPQQAEKVTAFKTHPVRFLSVADNGTLCLGYNGEIYIKNGNAEPVRVNVRIVRDEVEQPADITFTAGASEATVSSNGKQMAFMVRGDVYVTSVEYNTTRQITQTPQRERWVDFSPDGRTLVYASERNGRWNIYTAKMSREEEVDFPHATLIEEQPLFKDGKIERTIPKYSPDGKELAFVEDRSRLMVMNLASGKVREITDGKYRYRTDEGFTYSWSPDGKWFTLEFIGNKHDPYSDIGLVSAAGGGEITNLTQSGYFDMNPRWVLDGNAILFASERYGMRNHASWGSMSDVMIVFLNQETYDKFHLNKEEYELLQEEEKRKKENNKEKEEDKSKAAKPAEKKDIVVELKNIEDRIVRLTPNSSSLGDAVLNKDGSKLYYLAAFESGYDLWEKDLRSRATKIMLKLNARGSALELSKDGKELFVLGATTQKITLAGSKASNISYRAEMALDRPAEREFMFERVRKQIATRFYEPTLHGVDWEGMSRNYKRFLPYINNNYDFAELLSEWLGELNVSHTGGRYAPRKQSGDDTAELGLLFRWNEQGDGLLVDEVLEKGPFDRASSQMEAGCIIEKIDGAKIEGGKDYFGLLNKKQGKKVILTLYNPSTKARWEEVIKPISRGVQQRLLYERWVKQRVAEVERLSGGRLGYVHISSMDDENFRSVYSDILGRYNNCDGIVIDTRFNGGGRLHEDIEVLFSGEKYFTQVVRGKEACDMPSRRWNKPSIMIMGEANYSNAHGTPWVYHFKGIGKLVGMPVPGTMTSVSWETLQDNSLVFGIPIVGYRLPDGSYLENKQLEPDVKVANTPETVVKGRDLQLEKAVEELLKELGIKK